jgi:hypothetical protein
MSSSELYYTPPPIAAFMEMKAKAMELWKEVDTDNDKFGYASEKIGRIEPIGNVGDNFMYMVAMFDMDNQVLLANKLSQETRKEVRDRMVAGGNPPSLIVF